MLGFKESVTIINVSDCVLFPSGSVKEQSSSGAVVLADDLKNPAMEKLELVRKWSINTYKVSDSVSESVIR